MLGKPAVKRKAECDSPEEPKPLRDLFLICRCYLVQVASLLSPMYVSLRTDACSGLLWKIPRANAERAEEGACGEMVTGLL